MKGTKTFFSYGSSTDGISLFFMASKQTISVSHGKIDNFIIFSIVGEGKNSYKAEYVLNEKTKFRFHSFPNIQRPKSNNRNFPLPFPRSVKLNVEIIIDDFIPWKRAANKMFWCRRFLLRFASFYLVELFGEFLISRLLNVLGVVWCGKSEDVSRH